MRSPVLFLSPFVACLLSAVALGYPVAGSTAESDAAGEPVPVTEVESVFGPVRWGGLLSAHTYRESQMRLVGPALGIRAETVARPQNVPVNLEGEISVGLVNYASPVSGELNGLKRIGSMIHLSMAQPDARTWVPRPGLGLTTEWTDLRGVSSTGSGDSLRYFHGYERFNASVWLSGSWDLDRDRTEGAIRVRAALLVSGWQRSMLSQAVLGYGDVTTRQRRGASLSVEAPLRFDDVPASLRAGMRMVGRSDVGKANESVLVYEPANRTFEVALTIWR